MALESLILSFGYPVLFLGTLLEGETVLIMAGFLAHRGYLHLPVVLLVGFAGAVLGDEMFFFIGRHGGTAYLAARPQWTPAVERVRRLLSRHAAPLVVGIRFMYGLRVVGPLVVGASGYPVLRFLFFNVVGGVAWVLLVGLGGYFLGHALETLLGDLRRYELWIAASLLFLAGCIMSIRARRLRAQSLLLPSDTHEASDRGGGRP